MLVLSLLAGAGAQYHICKTLLDARVQRVFHCAVEKTLRYRRRFPFAFAPIYFWQQTPPGPRRTRMASRLTKEPRSRVLQERASYGQPASGDVSACGAVSANKTETKRPHRFAALEKMSARLYLSRMSLRLFAALALPDDIAALVLAQQRGVPGAHWRPRENLHLTLRFFGELSEPVAHDLDAELASFSAAPFELRLKGAGSFGGADPRTLWIGARASPALDHLAAACERAARRLRLKPEPRKFAPHVTLASLRGAALDRVQAFEARLALFESPPFRVESFGLYSSFVRKSAPSHYRLEAEYPLGSRT
jgi:RNA 2',3'-cyclic 3'-phosphodiesterase